MFPPGDVGMSGCVWGCQVTLKDFPSPGISFHLYFSKMLRTMRGNVKVLGKGEE